MSGHHREKEAVVAKDALGAKAVVVLLEQEVG